MHLVIKSLIQFDEKICSYCRGSKVDFDCRDQVHYCPSWVLRLETLPLPFVSSEPVIRSTTALAKQMTALNILTAK